MAVDDDVWVIAVPGELVHLGHHETEDGQQTDAGVLNLCLLQPLDVEEGRDVERVCDTSAGSVFCSSGALFSFLSFEYLPNPT